MIKLQIQKRALRIMEEVAGQQTSKQKLKQNRKAANSSNPIPSFSSREREAEGTITMTVNCLAGPKRLIPGNAILVCVC
jgi:hypothetical protein